MSYVHDTCANCGAKIRGELIGALSGGPLYDWIHDDDSRPGRYRPGCEGHGSGHAPRAIPASSATHDCPVHRKVSRYHRCRATRSRRLFPRDLVRHEDGRTGMVNGDQYVGEVIEVLWQPASREDPDDYAEMVPAARLTLVSRGHSHECPNC